MQTQYYVVNRDIPDANILARGAAIIKNGGLVAFPTETVYGLGADGLSAEAVTGIFRAKGRPADNPLILHIATPDEAARLVSTVPANARVLMERYWPGPLTLVLHRSPLVPDAVTGGAGTVAIRLPAATVARELIKAAGLPIAAPSANLSGRPSPTTAAAVMADLAGRIDAVIDGGPCVIGVESTVVDCTTPVPTLLRPGGITLEMLRDTLGEVDLDPALAEASAVPRSPGMKYTHYAPAAPLTLIEGYPEAAARHTAAIVSAAAVSGQKVGAIVSAETASLLPPDVAVAVYGRRSASAEAAANIYNALRFFDHANVDVIYAEGLAEDGLGLAVMNRLRKAAGYRIIRAE